MEGELIIRDRWGEGPGPLVPLCTVLRVMTTVREGCLNGTWQIFRGAEGYGLRVCEIADAVSWRNRRASITVVADAIMPALFSGDEYFNNVRMKKVDSDIEVGIVDSTFLYVRGTIEFLEEVGAHFKHIELRESPDFRY